MRARALAALGIATGLTLAACAGARVADGVFDSPKGYRVRLPGGGWEMLEPGEVDLALRHRAAAAMVVVHATCDPSVARRPADVLLRHVVVGLADRRTVERTTTRVDARPAVRAVLDGRSAEDGTPARVEAVVVQGERCVYDLVYAARPGAFEDRRADFGRLVESLVAR